MAHDNRAPTTSALTGQGPRDPSLDPTATAQGPLPEQQWDPRVWLERVQLLPVKVTVTLPGPTPPERMGKAQKEFYV